MPQAVLNSTSSRLDRYWQRLRIKAQLVLLGCREMLALMSLVAGLGLGFLVLAEGMARVSGA